VIISFTRQADADFDYFKKSGNQQLVKKIKELLQAMTEDHLEV